MEIYKAPLNKSEAINDFETPDFLLNNALAATSKLASDKDRLVTIEQMSKQFEDSEMTNFITDGSHTFDELYGHRVILTACLAKIFASMQEQYSLRLPDSNYVEEALGMASVWRSKLHSDGTMFNHYFIIGFNTPVGQYSYHYHEMYWDLFDTVEELDNAPEWDGHKPEDIMRLMDLVNLFFPKES